MLQILEWWHRRRELPYVGRHAYVFWPLFVSVVVIAVLGLLVLGDAVLQLLNQRHLGPLLRDRVWAHRPGLVWAGVTIALGVSVLAVRLALTNGKGQPPIAPPPVPPEIPFVEKPEDDFVALYEANTKKNEDWERLLKYAINGPETLRRYARIKGREWKDLGLREYLGVNWRGLDTGPAGTLVEGPYCLADGWQLRHSVAGMDTPITDDDTVYHPIGAQLYCRKCREYFALGTDARYSAKMEKIFNVRHDVELLFEESVTQ